MTVHTYEGTIYVRPVMRGVILEETELPEEYLDQWVERVVPSGTYANVRITLEVLDG